MMQHLFLVQLPLSFTAFDVAGSSFQQIEHHPQLMQGSLVLGHAYPFHLKVSVIQQREGSGV